ncbi:hypothetical protein [Brachyspira intermedia]|uniref:hypothetical protein n=1 Tax=Brachyspira intermedia TaxID=84377 RepID=UPI002603845C|nr:hypothetical protein [uncultured Brachyspira sp.]
MVIASVESKNAGKNELVENGIPLNVDDIEVQKKWNCLLERLPHKSYVKDDIFQINENEILCRMKHPEKDQAGRNRIVYIVWDKEASDEMIKKTVETIGLNYDSFLKLKNTFDKKKTQKLMLIALIVVVLAIVILILK